MIGATDTDQTYSPVTVIKAGNQDSAGSMARCVDKIVMIDIDADMRKRLAIHVKKNQITGLQIAIWDFRECLGHLFCCTR